MGGVLDQPAHEIIRLEKTVEAINWLEEAEMKKGSTRQMNRARHAPTVERDNTV